MRTFYLKIYENMNNIVAFLQENELSGSHLQYSKLNIYIFMFVLLCFKFDKTDIIFLSFEELFT